MSPETFKQKIISELKTIKPSEVELYKRFMRYWSEPTKSGKLIRYDLQKTWSTNGRWAMFKSNAKEYNRKQQVLKPKQAELKFVSAEDRALGREKMEALKKKLFRLKQKHVTSPIQTKNNIRTKNN